MKEFIEFAYQHREEGVKLLDKMLKSSNKDLDRTEVMTDIHFYIQEMNEFLEQYKENPQIYYSTFARNWRTPITFPFFRRNEDGDLRPTGHHTMGNLYSKNIDHWLSALVYRLDLLNTVTLGQSDAIIEELDKTIKEVEGKLDKMEEGNRDVEKRIKRINTITRILFTLSLIGGIIVILILMAIRKGG